MLAVLAPAWHFAAQPDSCFREAIVGHRRLGVDDGRRPEPASRAANWYARQLTSGDTRLVCSGAAIRLVEKLTYREIYKFRSFLQSSVASRRHNDELPIRQAPEYLDRFLYRREIVIASHDENRCRDLFEVGGFDRDGGYPHGVALPQHRHPMSGTVGADPPVVGPEVWRQCVRYCLKLVGKLLWRPLEIGRASCRERV